MKVLMDAQYLAPPLLSNEQIPVVSAQAFPAARTPNNPAENPNKVVYHASFVLAAVKSTNTCALELALPMTSESYVMLPLSAFS